MAKLWINLLVPYFATIEAVALPLQTTEIEIIFFIPIYATRKAVAPFSNIQSCWADKYGSIDTSNINIGPLVIILWQNILGQPHYLS